MKKLLHLKAILLTLCLSVVGSGSVCYADRVSTFTDKNLTVSEGELGWTSSHAAQQFESNGSSSYEPRGVQFGTSKAPINVFTLTANESLNGVTSVTIVASASGAGNTIAVKVGDTNFNGEVTEIASGTANANKEYTFTGEATNGVITITIDDNTKAVWVKSISVKNQDVVPGKEAAGLSFGETTRFTADLNGTFTAPTLTKTTDAAATYTSSETSVATVDASTGAVTLVGAGTTTITATTPETDAYMAGSASYTLTVTDLASMPKFQKATTITSGKRYLIVVENGGELVVGEAISNPSYTYGYLYPIAPAATDGDGNIYMEDITNAFTFTAVDGGGYTIQQADGRFLFSDSHASFQISDEATADCVWNVEAQSDGTLMITCTANGKFIQYNTGYNNFAVYDNEQGNRPMLYEEVGGKEAPEFSFAAQTATLNLLDAGAFTAPVLTNTSDGAVTYTCSDNEVATIDADGRIEALAQGTTTITATVAETDEFTAATAEFTLHVTTLSDYMKTTAVESGKTYILAADNEGTAVIAQTVAANSRYDYLPVNEAGTAALMGATDLLNGFTLTETEGGYTIQDAYGRYLYMDETHTSFNVSADRQDGDTWTVEPQADGTVKITNVLREKFIQYSTEHESYGAYTDEQGIKPSLYVKNSIEVNEDGYATAYSDNAVILPEGLQAAVITGVADGKLTIDYRYNSGDVIPAGTAVLVKGEAGAHDYNLATSDEQAVTGNLLKGAASDVATEGDGCLFYMLSYDANHQNLGFYWAAEDGAAFTSKAGKAYLALPQAASAGVTGYALDGTPVGIDQATTDAQAPAVIYTVDGRLVQQTDVKDLPKGLYIVNGKKVIIK